MLIYYDRTLNNPEKKTPTKTPDNPIIPNEPPLGDPPPPEVPIPPQEPPIKPPEYVYRGILNC